jgi:hypothetical protein
MPRDGAIIFGDLIGKLSVLRVEAGRIIGSAVRRAEDGEAKSRSVQRWVRDVSGSHRSDQAGSLSFLRSHRARYARRTDSQTRERLGRSIRSGGRN